ncbi:MAG: antitoxin [Steroidobacteraceae bacterium]
MRTTLTIDPDILSAARQIADAKSKSIGEVISELARRGLEARAKVTTRQGYPVFPVTTGAPPLTPEDVRRDEDEL